MGTLRRGGAPNTTAEGVCEKGGSISKKRIHSMCGAGAGIPGLCMWGKASIQEALLGLRLLLFPLMRLLLIHGQRLMDKGSEHG